GLALAAGRAGRVAHPRTGPGEAPAHLAADAVADEPAPRPEGAQEQREQVLLPGVGVRPRAEGVEVDGVEGALRQAGGRVACLADHELERHAPGGEAVPS